MNAEAIPDVPLEMKGGWLVPAARMHRVALVLTRHGFGELAQRLINGRSEEQLVRNRQQLGKRIAAVLADLGPTYIKLGQLLGTREDLFPPDVTQALSQLHSDVPAMKAKV